MQCKYYSQRMLNPYHGIVNAVEIAGADAVSRDGLHWSLYVQHVDEDGAQYPDIKYGDWSERDGLKRYPIRYVADYAAIDRKGEQLLQMIRKLHDELPFPAADCYELWLLNKVTLQPLALVGAACEQPEREIESVFWRAGITARKDFESSAVCELIEGLINKQVAADAIWLRRKADGTGVSLGSNRLVAYSDFPKLLLDSSWAAGEGKRLLLAYTCWQAPWLLELQSLDGPARQALEEQASNRVQLVSERYRNYPRVIDESALKAMLVEARLRDTGRIESEEVEEAAIDFFQSGN